MNEDTLDRLQEIEAHAEAATRGPWEIEDDGYDRGIYMGDDPEPGKIYVAQQVNQGVDPHDATFIASSRSDVPWLVAQLREALARQDRSQADRYGSNGPARRDRS